MNNAGKNEKLEKALRDLARDRVFVPPSKNEELVSAIRKHFDADAPLNEGAHAAPSLVPILPKRAFPRRKFRPWQRWMPLAASVAIGAFMIFFSRPPGDRADINRDGAVDIVDALLLAEQISNRKGRDVNGDDAVNEADVAEIAARAVLLERSGS